MSPAALTHTLDMTPLPLNHATLGSALSGTIVPQYDRSSTRIGIVHIGPGAFHRAHQAFYADGLLATDHRWAISALSLKSTTLRDAITPQQGLYTLVELGETQKARIIGAIRELLVAPADSERAFARLSNADTRLVSLTVTEKGYCLNARNELDLSHEDIVHDIANPARPRSSIGWITEALRRRRAFGLSPFTVLSCDNLSNNGETLKRALVAFAGHTDTELAKYLAAELVCPRTMVDSITPATDEDLRTRVAALTGFSDNWPVQREPFTQWVVEDLAAMREADWEGVGVTLAKDVSVYDRAKLRLLNGAHSTLAYLGLLRGHQSVAEAMRDNNLASFIERLMRDDIAPSLGPAPGFDVPRYISAILERFRNPGIRHLLSQIAWDGSKKLPVRVGATLSDALSAGRPINRLLVPFAAWMRFVIRQARDGAPLVDPDAVQLAAVGSACTGDRRSDIAHFMNAGMLPLMFDDIRLGIALEDAFHQLGTAAHNLGVMTVETTGCANY